MNIVTLAEIKAHTRIDGNVEDSILTIYGDSAEGMVLNLLGRDLESIAEEYGCIPTSIKHATLLLVAHSYTQREPASMQNLYQVPYSVDALLKPYMIL